MSTNDLIAAARAAWQEYNDATANAELASERLQTARDALAAANLALHDDLAANGAAVMVDDSVTPPVVTLYTAAEPDTYVATPIRVAA